jgi:uncharacterized protein YcsI (UPF0317 family)
MLDCGSTPDQQLTRPLAPRRGEASVGVSGRGTTGGHCPAYQQANLVILPQEAAVEFAAFCTRNPAPCPLH